MIGNRNETGAQRNLRALFVGGAALLFLAAAAPADVHPGPLTEPDQYRLLDAFLAGKPDPTDIGYSGGGTTAQTLAMLGREDLVMGMPIFHGHGRPRCDALLENGKAVDPVAYIAAKAAGVRVTMINEAHDMPQTRAFAAKVAAALRPAGYSLYAGETFYDGIGATAPSWPLMSDGRFANDPIYGRLIRSLRRQDYRLLAYEDHSPQDGNAPMMARMAKREINQAKNLEAGFKTAPASARLLVHVGYAHLAKDWKGAPFEMMAAHFREDTGIDPLTVDQTQFWSQTGRYEICDTSARSVPDPSAIYVGMPTPSFTRHRPDWRLQEGDMFVEIPDALRRPSEPAIYEAHLVGEPNDAVPMDRILVRPGETDIPLMLPPGRYRVAVWTKKAGWSTDVPLTAP